MNIKTAFNCGDMGWIYFGSYYTAVQQATIGKIQIEYTNTKKWNDILEEYEVVTLYEEKYMCDQTGIGCGTVYTLDKTIFRTKEEAKIGFSSHIAIEAARVLEVQSRERKELLSREAYLRDQLAKIDTIKLEEENK